MKKPLSFATVAFFAVAIPSLAVAGKPERDKQKELTPKVNEAKAAIKATCGCDVAVIVKWDGFKKADDMARVPEGLTDVVTAAKAHCDDADEKKVFCSHVSAFEIIYDPKGDVKVDGKTITCGVDGSAGMHCGDHQVTRELDKF